MHGDVITLALAPHIAHQLHLAAIAGRVIANRQRTVIIAGHARRLLHGADSALVAGVIAAEYLIVGIIHQIIRAAGSPHLIQRIGARGDRLRLERFQRKAVAHLIGHHAQQVFLDGDMQHSGQHFSIRLHMQIAAIQRVIAIQAQAVFQTLRCLMAGKNKLLAAVQRHALVIDHDAPCRAGQHQPGAALKAHAVQRIAAVQGDFQPVGQVQARQQHAHGILFSPRAHRQRKADRQQHYQRGKPRDPSFEGSAFGHDKTPLMRQSACSRLKSRTMAVSTQYMAYCRR